MFPMAAMPAIGITLFLHYFSFTINNLQYFHPEIKCKKNQNYSKKIPQKTKRLAEHSYLQYNLTMKGKDMPKNNVQKIAERAGVSIATVSRILNGKLGHAPETILRVKTIADELAQENKHSAPVSAISHAIGVVVYQYANFLNNVYTATLIDGIVSAANAQGYSTMLLTVTESTCNTEYIRNMTAFYRLHGLIIPGNHYLYKLILDLQKTHIPTVGINANIPGIDLNVYCDSFRSGNEAASYLINHGHRRVGFISISKDFNHVKLHDGFIQTYSKVHPEEKVLCWQFKDLQESIFGTLNTISCSAAPPTALYFTNSELARRFMLAFRNSNLRIPEDLSILSSEESGELLDFGVTTLAQPTHQMGEAAAKLLLQQIHKNNDVREVEFICSFKERSSICKLNKNSFRFHHTQKTNKTPLNRTGGKSDIFH